MHASLFILIATITTSVVSVPIPIDIKPSVDSLEPLMVREVNRAVISPVFDTIKRKILERLDATIQHTPDT